MSVEQKHTYFTDDQGLDFRDISDVLTSLGMQTSHSSVHNHLIYGIKKFVVALAEKNGVILTDDQATKIAKMPEFQRALSSSLHSLGV